MALSNSFTVENKAMDVDKHMYAPPSLLMDTLQSIASVNCRLAYIETEMKKKKGVQESSGSNQAHDPLAQLYQIPEHLQAQGKKAEEGNVTVSSGMLTAIPEIDLGIEYLSCVSLGEILLTLLSFAARS